MNADRLKYKEKISVMISINRRLNSYNFFVDLGGTGTRPFNFELNAYGIRAQGA